MRSIDIVAIGASNGGPEALRVLLPELANLGVPVVIVQHIPSHIAPRLTPTLQTIPGVDLSEAQHGMALEAGKMYLAPSDHHVTVERSEAQARLSLNRGRLENFSRPAIDVLFRSIAARYADRALAVILTGIGCDGLEGVRMVRAAGGYVLAQNRETAAIWDTPRAVVEAGLAHEVLPLAAIRSAVAARTLHARRCL